MNQIYTEEHIRFLRKNFRGTSRAEITRMFNERFSMTVTEFSISYLLKKNRFLNEHYRKYALRHIEFLRRHCAGRGNAELVKLFNKKFGMAVNERIIQNIKSKYGLYSGVNSGQFQKGHVSCNKNMKGHCFQGSEKGWIKPGHPGYLINKRPIGSERVSRKGYVEIKIVDKKCKDAKERRKNWRAKHVVVWEKANGPVPKGYIVIFLDGDRTHIVLENLMMISRKVHMVMCHLNWYTNDMETTRAHCIMGGIKVAAANLKRKVPRLSLSYLRTHSSVAPEYLDD